jgi:REP element-mobilizing transposase RayT
MFPLADGRALSLCRKSARRQTRRWVCARPRHIREECHVIACDERAWPDCHASPSITRKADVEVWAYCLMPNHVHLILCPRHEKGLSQALGAAHKPWANFINGRGRWRGHLFDNRFASVDEGHLISAVRRSGGRYRIRRAQGCGAHGQTHWKRRFRQGLGAHSRPTHCAARARPQTFQDPRRPATPALTQLTLVLAPYSERP